MNTKLYIGACMLFIGGLYSCQKDNELDKLDANYRVATDYDPNAEFASFRSGRNMWVSILPFTAAMPVTATKCFIPNKKG